MARVTVQPLTVTLTGTAVELQPATNVTSVQDLVVVRAGDSQSVVLQPVT